MSLGIEATSCSCLKWNYVVLGVVMKLSPTSYTFKSLVSWTHDYHFPLKSVLFSSHRHGFTVSIYLLCGPALQTSEFQDSLERILYAEVRLLWGNSQSTWKVCTLLSGWGNSTKVGNAHGLNSDCRWRDLREGTCWGVWGRERRGYMGGLRWNATWRVLTKNLHQCN